MTDYKEIKLNREDLMLKGLQSEIGTTAGKLQEHLDIFEARYPNQFQAISAVLYAKTDMDLGDLLTILNTLADFQ